MSKAVIILTGHCAPFYDDGSKTGVFFVEAFHPFKEFRKAGLDVTFVSENGSYGFDDHSLSEDFLTGEDREAYENKDSEFMQGLKNIKKAADVNPDDFDIVFVSAGHAVAFDYPHAKAAQNIVRTLLEGDKVVAAVCHGLCIFENLLGSNGKYLIEGKNVTGFTNEGEVQLDLVKILEKNNIKTPQAVAEECGANYISPPGPWDSFSVVDGKLVTGVNPQSSVVTAEKALALLK